jgi:polyhydroxybutyrate depolymerase
MKRVLRIFLRGLIVVIVLAIALFGYFVYSPSPEVPQLSGKLTEGTVQVGALKRIYMTYVPKALAK